MADPEIPGIRLRRVEPSDAQAIGAVFDAAVRVGWTYLGELASRPMFTAAEWDKDVADHAPPNLMLVATAEGGRVVGFTAVHPQDCEMYLLFVDPAASGLGSMTSRTNASRSLQAAMNWRSVRTVGGKWSNSSTDRPPSE